ncbi:hypothetical protein C8Q79DRAFT_922698 [Trametes meyenii]|nr:hypothetical protein C8Q79DRAFT_922698 [Trametes meyenii]
MSTPTPALALAPMPDHATTPPQPTQLCTPPTHSKSRTVFEVLLGSEVTDNQLHTCATLFSENYGVWAADVSPPLKPARLRKECLAFPENSLLIMCTVQDQLEEPQLIRHAFVTKWPYQNGYVGWITQLVIDIKQRRRFVATSMLQQLRLHSWLTHVTMMGMVSSHPAACNTLCKLINGDTCDVDLEYIRTHARAVLDCSTVKYLKDAQLRGAFLGEPGGSYSAFTSFFVDHTEPLEVLQFYIERDRWSFGPLLDGHEFLILVSVPEDPNVIAM